MKKMVRGLLSSVVSQGKDSAAYVDKAQSSKSASSLDTFLIMKTQATSQMKFVLVLRLR